MYTSYGKKSSIKKHRKENNPIFAELLKKVIKKKLGEEVEEEEESEDDDVDIYKRHNHIYYKSQVNGESVSRLRQLMERYREEVRKIGRNEIVEEVKTKPLYIHISSSGGCLISGLNMYDYIKDYRRDIEVICIVDGNAYSSASLMTMAGSKRYITPNSFILIHQLSTYNGWMKYEELLDDKKNCDELMKKTKEIYMERCKFTKRELDSILKRDLYLSAEECLKKGLVDEIRVR